MRPEHWFFTVPLRIRSLFRRRRVETEMDEELRFHLEHKIEEGVAAGLTREEARRRRSSRWAGWTSARRRSATPGASTG